jgi:regulator of protease activity HflC (stomatin/prohibitin superfamily)
MKRKLIIFGIIALVISIIVTIIVNSTFLTIDAGFRGIVFRPFSGGLDKKHVYKPGFHLIVPWNKIYIYDVRETQLDETISVLASNGMNIKLNVCIRINPFYDKLGEIHERFGMKYQTTFVRPELSASVKKIVGRFRPDELYSSKKEELAAEISKDLSSVFKANFIDLRSFMVKDVELPANAKKAIEEKIAEEQKVLKYEYILAQELKEKERLLIEASAKSEANAILSAGLSDKVLAEKGIEATLKLANSTNAKIVIIGNDKNGLPLILGNQ